jgi:hypothetical protein
VGAPVKDIKRITTGDEGLAGGEYDEEISSTVIHPSCNFLPVRKETSCAITVLDLLSGYHQLFGTRQIPRPPD